MIKAVIFDFDGVLVESVDIKTEAFRKLFTREGTRVAEQVVAYHLRNTGVSRFDKFRYIYKEILKRPLSDEEFHRLCDGFARLVADAVVKTEYVKGAREFLELFSASYACFVSSATPEDEIKEIIRLRRMDEFFQGIYGAPRKKTEIVKEILLSYELEPAQAVYVGDALSDYNAARENGVHFVARIKGNEALFQGIDCPRIADLTQLSAQLVRFIAG